MIWRKLKIFERVRPYFLWVELWQIKSSIPYNGVFLCRSTSGFLGIYILGIVHHIIELYTAQVIGLPVFTTLYPNFDTSFKSFNPSFIWSFALYLSRWFILMPVLFVCSSPPNAKHTFSYLRSSVSDFGIALQCLTVAMTWDEVHTCLLG